MSHETPPRGNGQASDQANKVGQASVGTAGRQVNFKAHRSGQIRAESFPGTTTDPGATPTQTDTPTLTDPRGQGSSRQPSPTEGEGGLLAPEAQQPSTKPVQSGG